MHTAENVGAPRGFNDLFTDRWGFVSGDVVQNIMRSKCGDWEWGVNGGLGLINSCQWEMWQIQEYCFPNTLFQIVYGCVRVFVCICVCAIVHVCVCVSTCFRTCLGLFSHMFKIDLAQQWHLLRKKNFWEQKAASVYPITSVYQTCPKTHTDTYMLTYIHTYIQTHTHTHTHTHTYLRTYIHSYKHTHTHTHIYTNTYIHSYMQALAPMIHK